MGVPSATRPLASGGWDPHQTSMPSAAMPGGGGARRLYTLVLPWLAATPACAAMERVRAVYRSAARSDDVDVVQVRCQQLPVTQVGSRLSERMVLPQYIQGGGKWVTLFDPFPLGDLVVLAKVVPPMVLGEVAIHGTGERDQLRYMLAKGREHGVARDAIVCSPAIDGNDGGSGIQVDCCAQHAGQGIHAGTRLEGELIGPGCGVDTVCECVRERAR